MMYSDDKRVATNPGTKYRMNYRPAPAPKKKTRIGMIGAVLLGLAEITAAVVVTLALVGLWTWTGY